jgi:D-alanine-D-alanine ligase
LYFKDKNHGQSIDEQIVIIAKNSTNGKLKAHVHKEGGRLPVVESEESYKFFEKIQNIAQKMEITVKLQHFNISSDVSLAPDNIPVIEGFGPLAENCGAPDEYIIRDSLIDRSALLAMVIYYCSKKNKDYRGKLN